MRRFEIDGRSYVGYEPDELGAPPVAPRNHPKTAELSMLSRLFGSWRESGPLMDACRRAAEFESRGGHSPSTMRRARREFYFPEGSATLG